MPVKYISAMGISGSQTELRCALEQYLCENMSCGTEITQTEPMRSLTFVFLSSCSARTAE